MKRKTKCCKKYRSKAKACKRCPLMAALGKKKRRRLLERYAATAALLIGFTGCTSPPPATPPAAEEVEVELAVLMGEMQRHSAKLGYALSARNPPLAEFYLDEVVEVLGELEEVEEHEGFPIRDTSRTIMTSPVTVLGDALAAPDWAAAELGYAALIDGCNRCHAATEHEFIVILPAAGEPPFNQDFQPAGTPATSTEDSDV